MVFLQPRKLLAALILCAALACGRGGGAEQSAAEPPAAAFEGRVENGDPMPPADHAGGVPPYPGALVWMRNPRPPSEFHALEAFTPDSFPRVVAWYDSMLSGWTRTIARDAVHYHQEPEVAVIVSPWEGGVLSEEHPAALREARTSIGLAWRAEPPRP